ncbi:MULTISPECIES: type I-F CRISPR-associated protein Csy1 [unclassified Gilliamella]|uniref:type I-F CRISPR-associated protein Csy1 n=1 Tax=unclassified Gilliamella TaxID=2685620 RepID=UPI0013223A39|nr:MULTISPECIES: type I-F CRISPR-associated protein Csy1 [unclassified Gilliamella]MWN31920.1 type I-F CRISPR-associated protein Csy1 [Gilliamella sp. Pra-s60]MWP29158.1 type I-F CRISPR-associated protein Csy1 [Gilliamella sp. Pra-s54]
MNSISWQDIRKVILEFLQQRLANNSSYKSEVTKLEKAKEAGDQVAVNETQQKLDELAQRFDFETWMEDAATRRILWISMGTNNSKSIHSSSLGDNINYSTQSQPINQLYVSSATPITLPLDCSGNAAALDIFSLLNQFIIDDVTFLKLIVNDHPAVLAALSDDKEKASLYLANFKKAIFNDFGNPKASELNKQLYWPNSEETYLSQQENNYRLLIPLHPSSLCNLVYQKVQTRFSEENKKARELRRIKEIEHQPYFSFHHLAVVKLGGSNPQGVSQLTSSQGGRNFLLPSMPPKFEKSCFPSITERRENIFNDSLQYFCSFGFNTLFDMVKSSKNTIKERDDRKDAFVAILSPLLKFAKHIQQNMPAGWSREYLLKLNQKLWLDPKRAELEGEEDFKRLYEQGEWLNSLEKDFSKWIENALDEKFKDLKIDFSDNDSNEWRREFRTAVKASQRKREGIF